MRVHLTANELISKCSTSDYFSQITTRENLYAAVSGMLTFPAMLGIFHHTLWKTLGVASHLKLSPLYGLISVCASGFVSCAVTTSVRDFCMGLPIFMSYSRSDIIICTTLSVIHFAIFSRRLKMVLPSHVLHPGAYARKTVPLDEITSRVTESQKRSVQKLGYKYGCHTCGVKYSRLNKVKRYIVRKWFPLQRKPNSLYYADHSPPVALAPVYLKRNKNAKGSLLPQCQSCSYFQATRVRLLLQNPDKYKNKDSLVTHSLRFKLCKIWLPWPILINSDVLLSYLHTVVEMVLKIF
ncbi:uncharacterized protein LOC144743288 [Ciona intestinalis]